MLVLAENSVKNSVAIVTMSDALHPKLERG